MRALHRLAAIATLTALSSIAPVALAQSDFDRATARELGQQGFAALDQKDYATAEDRLRRADKLVHAPTLLLGLARAVAGQHKYVEAQELYQRIIREGVAPGSPEAFKQALEDAKKEVGTVSPLIGGVTIVVQGGADIPNKKVAIDGTPVNAASLGVRRAIDPGAHVITVTGDGYKPAELKITVPEGGSIDAPVTLEKDPNWVPPAVPTAPTGTETPTGPTGPAPGPTGVAPGGEQPSGGMPSYLPWIGFGVGAAGLVFGAITGVVALGDHSTLTKECTGSSCDPSHKSDLDSYHTMGALSTTGFIVGGVGAAAGVVLLLMQPGGAPAATGSSAGAPAAAGGLHVTPVVGVGTFGAVGTF